MRNLPTISSKLIEKQGATDFIVILKTWNSDGLAILFGFVWTGLDNLRTNKISQIDFDGDEAQIERNITQILVSLIREIMLEEFSPLRVEHSPSEMTRIKNKQAKPPEYDFAFYLKQRAEILFPFEAKVLKIKGSEINISDYVDTINSRITTGIYAPYSSHVAMVGYLLDAESILEILESISKKLNTQLSNFPNFQNRDHKVSEHLRTNGITLNIFCHHMIYPILKTNSR
jgi:hypothetical protein